MTLKVINFRAINSAQIDLDGITVITGENGSGKSTLSRILYNTIKYSKKYELLIIKELNADLGEIPTTLFNLVQEIANYGDNGDAKSLLAFSRNSGRHMSLRSGNMDNIQEYEHKLLSYLTIIRDYVSEENVSPQSRMRIRRIGQILRDTLKEGTPDSTETLSLLKSKIADLFGKAYENYDSRPINLFSKQLRSLFHQPIEKNFELIEYGLPITDWKGGKLNNTSWIKNAIYVDTPMAINDQQRFSTDSYWNELNSELLDDSDAPFFGRDDLTYINDVIAGDVYYDLDILDGGYKFKRNDDREFGIDDCATGIKAFGILQMLLNNGKLTKNTLLIVDEPEAHLHPQWIVEYARILVLLNKQIGVKFFIASHSPDMASAIKYISEKEEISDRVNFYLAERTANNYTYNYKALKTDIEEIFSSFNIAIERVSQYGSQDA
jgi:energy-coupling factor transporter ATP-binding protein EcfA2